MRQVRQAEVLIQVPFHDVDSMHVVWHGHYLKYFEIARCELLETFDYGYRQMQVSGYAWPVIDVHMRYGQPARFGDQIRIQATLKDFEQRLKISYKIFNEQSGKRLTRGSTTQVAIDLRTSEMCYRSPDILFQKLGIEP